MSIWERIEWLQHTNRDDTQLGSTFTLEVGHLAMHTPTRVLLFGLFCCNFSSIYMSALCQKRAWREVVGEGLIKSKHNVESMTTTHTKGWRSATFNTLDAPITFLDAPSKFNGQNRHGQSL